MVEKGKDDICDKNPWTNPKFHFKQQFQLYYLHQYWLI